MAGTLGSVRAIAWFGSLALLWVALLPAAAQAQDDELRAFEQARQAYLDADYADAVQRFELLVGGPVPTLENPALVLESRKYLGAAYLFVGRPTDADRQFEALLRADADYLIPASFPEAVQEAFASTRQRLQSESEQAAADAARRERLRREEEMRRIVEQQARMARLEELARYETVERRNSRWLAMLPFGVGQFRNEDDRLGRFLAWSEGSLAVVSVGTALWWSILRARADRLDPTFRRRARRGLILTNWVSTGGLAALAIVGILQAQLRFRPLSRTRRERDPEELEPTGEETVEPATDGPPTELSFGVGPSGLDLRLSF